MPGSFISAARHGGCADIIGRRAAQVHSVDRHVVYVWHARFDDLMQVLPSLEAVLAPDEIERADRFHSARDRARYAAGRGALRMILSRHSGVAPRRLRFHYGPYGKPLLAAGGDIQFNLSHSGELVLFAVTAGRQVGIDVECMARFDGLDALAQHYFSARERAAYRATDAGQRHEAFYACWTRKEAFLKATGFGLSMPLSDFDVSLEPDKPAALLSVRTSRNEASRWSIQDVSPEAGYKAAVAVEGTSCRLETRRIAAQRRAPPQADGTTL